jgi:hypothetical protein
MRESIPAHVREKVLQRDGYRCRYCGSESGPFHMDHVYPCSKGGETTVNNLVTACERCNTQKSSKVGLWPKPVGHFGSKAVNPYLWMGIADLVLAFVLLLIGSVVGGWLALGVGAVLLVLAAAYSGSTDETE